MGRWGWLAKQSRQKTGRPGVGTKGTVVAFPHFVQVTSVRVLDALPESAELAITPGSRFSLISSPLRTERDTGARARPRAKARVRRTHA